MAAIGSKAKREIEDIVMPCTITIGEKFLNSDDFEEPAPDVRRITLPDAPDFPNDAAVQPKANWRYVNFPAWKAMAAECDLEGWFEKIRLNGKDSDEIVPLTDVDYRLVNEVYLIRTAFAEGQPGWDYQAEDGTGGFSSIGDLPETHKFDEYLARLAWLRFWIRWALDNCKEPSVVVSW